VRAKGTPNRRGGRLLIPFDIDYLKKKRDSLKALKDPWLQQYQILGKYIYAKKQNFLEQTQEGAFLNDGMINDSTAARANAAMASAIMGALWKSGGKTFRIRRPKNIPDTKQNNEYYFRVNEEIAEAMESVKAGFEPAFHEEICEEGAFGTGCIALFQGDYENPLLFRSWSIQNILINEGADGYIDTVYYDEKITLTALVARYGKENLPEKLQKKYDNIKQRNDKVLLTVGIEPRPKEEQKGDGAEGMPVASYHFLPEEKHLLKESGYSEMPARVGRWYKLANEVLGRGPGMDALPAIMQINALRESFLVGQEKKVEPPLWIQDDGTLGGGTVDTSARGLSVFNTVGRTPGQAPIGTIFDIGELNSCAAAITETREEILQHFLIDRLYDLNNKTRMTLGEAEMRYQIRSDALASVYARYTAEILNPLITRAYSILFEMGLLGVAPGDYSTALVLEMNGITPFDIPPDVADAIAKGQKIYDIAYISPAAHVMREEEYRGIIATVNNAIQMEGANGDAMIALDTDRIVQYSAELSGAPMDIILSPDEIKVRRDARDKAQEAAQQAQLAEALTKSGKNIADARAKLGGGG